MKARIQSRVAEIRQSRGIGPADLARRVNVSRQTIYAIEAGTYVPNTAVSLLIAKELEVSIDDLFSLATEDPKSPESISAEILATSPPARGQALRICQIGSRWIGIPVNASPYFLPEADAVVVKPGNKTKRAELAVFSRQDASQKRIALAGCDPATSLLSRMVEKESGVEIVSAAASSKLALEWLKQGKVHIAGSHLEDPETGEFNVPYVRREFSGQEIVIVTFAQWEEGFVVAPGNPRGIGTAGDLAKPGLRFVNRETGSGSRALLDKLLKSAGLKSSQIAGYSRVAYGHLAAAHAIVSGDADACIATRSAARAFDLDFVPLHRERYDLVMRKRSLDLPAVKSFLDVLQRATLRRKLEVLAGYDTSHTGSLIS